MNFKNNNLFKYITYLIVTIIFTTLLYTFKITHFSFSIDTECILNDSADLLRSWYGIGRYGLCLFKEFFHTLPLHISSTNIIATLFLALCSFLWMLFFEVILQRKLKPTSKMAGMLLIVSSPIMAEQMGFVLQSVEIMLGFCLSAIGSILLIYYYKKRNVIILIVSSFFILITFTFYQAFVLLYITSVILYLICKNKDQNPDNKTMFKDIIKSIIIFLVIFIIYYLLDQYILNVLHIEKTSYLTNKYLWKTESLSVILKSITRNIIEVYSGYYNCYHPFFIILSFIFIYHYALKGKADYWKLLLSVCLTLVPVALIFITGSGAVGRSQFSIIITLAFYIVYFLEFANKKIIKALALILILFQSSITLYLQVSAQNAFNLDKQLAISISNTLKENHLENKKLAIVGSYNPNKMLKGEVLGHSFFEWDNFDGQTSNGRSHGFFKCIGLDYQFAYDHQLTQYYNLVKGKESFLKNKQVYIQDDVVIVKLYES